MEIHTKDERSLLLYFETCMVDDAGLVEGRRMNCIDQEIAERWQRAGFIRFCRLPSGIQYQIAFSPEAWEKAHKERRECSARLIRRAIESGAREELEVLPCH